MSLSGREAPFPRRRATSLEPAVLEKTIGKDYSEVKTELLKYASCDGVTFTKSQGAAFKHLYENRLTVLQGPPGTGKTDFIARAVITLCLYYKEKMNRDLHVLVTANSHPAIENVLVMIDKKLRGNKEIKLYKSERFSDGSESMGNIRVVPYDFWYENDYKDHPVVVGATNWSSHKMKGYEFDLVVIDEASQVRVMDAMLALSRTDQNEVLDTEDEDLQNGIEFVCGFRSYMQRAETDTEMDHRRFELNLDECPDVVIDVYKKRMKPL